MRRFPEHIRAELLGPAYDLLEGDVEVKFVKTEEGPETQKGNKGLTMDQIRGEVTREMLEDYERRGYTARAAARELGITNGQIYKLRREYGLTARPEQRELSDARQPGLHIQDAGTYGAAAVNKLFLSLATFFEHQEGQFELHLEVRRKAP